MKNDNIFFTKTTEIGAKNEPIEMFATGNRITPQPSATSVREGTVAFSDGGDLCYTKKDKNGVGRWFSFGLKINFNELNFFRYTQSWSGIKGKYDGNVAIVLEAKGILISPLEISITTLNMSRNDKDIKYEINGIAKIVANPNNILAPLINPLVLEPLEKGIEWLKTLQNENNEIDVSWQLFSDNDLLKSSEQSRTNARMLLAQDYNALTLLFKTIILKYPNLPTNTTPSNSNKFSVGNKVKIPKTKLGENLTIKDSFVVDEAISMGQDYLYLTQIIDSNSILLDYELSNTGDYFDIEKDNLELYQETTLNSNKFKVGDLVVSETSGKIRQILELNNADNNNQIKTIKSNGVDDMDYLYYFPKDVYLYEEFKVGDIVYLYLKSSANESPNLAKYGARAYVNGYDLNLYDLSQSILSVQWLEVDTANGQPDGEYPLIDFKKQKLNLPSATVVDPKAIIDEIKIGDIVELNSNNLTRNYNVPTGSQAEVIGTYSIMEQIDIKWLNNKTPQANGKYYTRDFTKVKTPETSTLIPATERPDETIERLLSYETSEMWSTKPTVDEVRIAFFSKRRSKSQKLIISQAFGQFRVIDKDRQFWQEFETAYYNDEGRKPNYDLKYYYKYFIKPEFYKLIPETPVWQLSELNFQNWNDDLVFPMYFENILKDSNKVDALLNAYEDFLENAETMQSAVAVEKPTPTKTPNVVTHNSVVPNKTLEDLKKEYSDLIFLISVTSPLDFKEMTELKQEAEQIKAHINSTNLSIKDKMLKENNIFDELFSSSCIQPKHRYDLKPDPNGYAPDGTPTQLPKSIYDFTLTNDFENWFGNFQLSYQFRNSNFTEVPCSIVKNIHYEPQIVYHGTGQEFSYFDFSKFPIMYFAENYFYAEWFAQQKGQENGHDGFVYPFFLDIKNPLDLTHFGIDEITSQEFADWLYLQTGLEADELKINPALMKSNNPTYAWVYLRNGAEMLKVLSDTKLFDGIVYYEQNPPINPTANNYKTKGFIIFEPQSAKIVDPERHNLLLGSMRSFYLKRGGKL